MKQKTSTIKLFIALLALIQFASLVYSQQSNEPLELILLQEYERAKCIDGTSPGYYFRQGSDEGKNNFMIHLQGGAWCKGTTEDEIIQDCIARSKTSLGSSSTWTQTMTNTANVDSSSTNNPAFYNWNVIFVNYCDGFAYQGNSQKEIDENTTLYFRGKENMLALFDHLIKNKGLSEANRIVFSGSSAGGIGATNWSQYLRSIIPTKTLVQLISDSGFFVDDGWFDPKMWRLQMDLAYNYQRGEIVPPNCEYLLDDSQLYKCVQPVYNYQKLTLPALFLLSSYDTYVLLIQKSVKCTITKNGFYSFNNCNEDQWKTIDELRVKTIQTLEEVSSLKSNISVWTVSCINHMFELDQPFYSSGIFSAPYPDGVSASKAILQFLNEPFKQRSYIDKSSYPLNEKCSYLAKKPSNEVY